MLLNGEYDDCDALFELHPGEGGTEAMDWAEMLFRMYKRYAERHNFKFELINEENISECILFAREWYSENEATSTLVREQKALECAFENYFKLNLIGAIIKVENKIVAFCIGEEMYNKNIFCTHFEYKS